MEKDRKIYTIVGELLSLSSNRIVCGIVIVSVIQCLIGQEIFNLMHM